MSEIAPSATERAKKGRSERRPKANAREDILDAAEQVFAAYGYEGASMRLIAQRAMHAQALLHYHFGTKEFYEAVFARRASLINEWRARKLDDMFHNENVPPSRMSSPCCSRRRPRPLAPAPARARSRRWCPPSSWAKTSGRGA